jgi:hypothetical protein
MSLATALWLVAGAGVAVFLGALFFQR